MNIRKIAPVPNGSVYNAAAFLKKGKISDYAFSSEINSLSTNQATGIFATNNPKNMLSLN